jgi:hypothetical protein
MLHRQAGADGCHQRDRAYQDDYHQANPLEDLHRLSHTCQKVGQQFSK